MEKEVAVDTPVTHRAASTLPLRTNFSWVLVGNTVYAICQWGILVALAKLGSPEMVGQFALGLAVTSPVLMLTSLKMRDVLATDAKREFAFSDYLGTRILTTIFALLLITGIVFLIGYQREARLVILAIGFAKSLEAMSDIYYGLLQAHERMDRIAKSLFLRGFLSLTALSMGVYLTHSVFWGVMGMAMAWALVLISYDIRSGAWIKKRIHELDRSSPRRDLELLPRWRYPSLISLIWLTLPLGIVELLCSLQDSISRFFVDKNLGASLLGIFAALSYFGRVGDLVVHAFGHSASPRLSKYFFEKNVNSFKSLTFKLVASGAGLGAAGILVAWTLGIPIVALVYKPEYVRQDVFVTLMLAAALNYVAKFMIYVLTAARYISSQMWLEIGVTIILTLCASILIPAYGLIGAAWAGVIACGLEASGALVLSLHAVSTLRK